MPPITRADQAPALDDLFGLVRVIELGSFAGAARELGVPTSTVSRAVQRLEATMGVRLLHRTTRSVRATEEGAELHQRVAPALLALRDAVRDVEASESAPRGRLRVTAPADIAATFIADVIGDFTRQHPEVDVELVITQRLVDLVAEGIDLAVRAGVLRDSSLISRRLGGVPAWLCAAPGYLERRGTPRTLADVSRHDLVLFRADRGRARWVLEAGPKRATIEVRGRIACDDFTFVRAALVAGAGLGLLPAPAAVRDIAEGKLVHVLGASAGDLGALHLVYPSSRHLPAKVTAFRDFLVERFAAYCRPVVAGRRRPRRREGDGSKLGARPS
ncbi:MAG: LysR family transcriptional regulator [Polyangiaceae bacterium]|nr:LysR family transcriptional regulator [Polyangiaceae bacterium]